MSSSSGRSGIATPPGLAKESNSCNRIEGSKCKSRSINHQLWSIQCEKRKLRRLKAYHGDWGGARHRLLFELNRFENGSVLQLPLSLFLSRAHDKKSGSGTGWNQVGLREQTGSGFWQLFNHFVHLYGMGVSTCTLWNQGTLDGTQKYILRNETFIRAFEIVNIEA